MWHKAHRVPSLNTHGFSIVELLIAMALTGIVVGSIYNVFISSKRSYHTQDSVADAQQRERMGIGFIERDIRLAGFDPGDTAGAGVELATVHKLRFTADRNRANGIEDTDEERITYLFDSANSRLRRCLYEGTGSETWQTIINGVNALTFAYLDVDNNTIATPVSAADLSDIRTVLISLTVQDTDAQGNVFTRTLNARVICRNLYF
jgi:type IV pilus assembly protein PilW